MRNKKIFVAILAVILVGISFFVFGEQKEIFQQPPPSEEIPPAKKEISVYVSGQVKNPAVVTFEDDENLKIVDAVNAAGGLTEFADTEFVNLSETLSNGQHIHIPTKEISLQEKTASAPDKNKNSSGGLININTADENELQKIRGVGPAIAQRIIDFREQNGNFKSIDEIKKVRGIGEKTFEKMKDSITVN